MSDFEVPDHGPTPPLADFLAAYAEDDNWWWRAACGHHQNWFEEAVDERDEALEALDRVRAFADHLKTVEDHYAYAANGIYHAIDGDDDE